MTDDPKTPPKEEPPHLVGWTKSYTVDGDTTEFNPRELQIHEFSPDLRAQLSHVKLPRLDPKYREDIILPNRSELAAQAEPVAEPSAAEPAVKTLAQPSPRRSRWKQGWPAMILALPLGCGALYFLLGAPKTRGARQIESAVASAPRPPEVARRVDSASVDNAQARATSVVQPSLMPTASTNPPAAPKSNPRGRLAKPESAAIAVKPKPEGVDVHDAPVARIEPTTNTPEIPQPAPPAPPPKPTASATPSSPQLIFQPQ